MCVRMSVRMYVRMCVGLCVRAKGGISRGSYLYPRYRYLGHRYLPRKIPGAKSHTHTYGHTDINAMLNYAYGVLIARTQFELIAEGYDPTIGILHGRESELGRYPAFALDRMEPMRPVVDRAVLELIAATTFTGADFSIQADGVCRLNPELARRVARLATDHSYEVVEDHS